MHRLIKLLPIAFAIGCVNLAHAEDYGKSLEIEKNLGFGPCSNAKFDNGLLYAIGNGKLHIYDASDPISLTLLGHLSGLGSTRQISIRKGIAYITSREDGLFIVDVSNPKSPKLLSSYDTVEFATGIDVSEGVAYVACRSYGVELIDVKDPLRPLHISTLRNIGEIQSVYYDGGYIYAGAWSEREIAICDVKRPEKPKRLAACKLDGNADGLFVLDGICYVATGHHSAEYKGGGEGAPGFGCGHGLEIFDVRNPSKPAFISRIKTPKYYALGSDMWNVKIMGGLAFLGDTWNGLFVIDVHDLSKPTFISRLTLPETVIPPNGKVHAPVYGFDVGDGVVYVAGGYTDLHIVKASGLAMPLPSKSHDSVQGEPETPTERPKGEIDLSVYKPIGQVHSLAIAEDKVFLAAGKSGLHVLDIKNKYSKLAEIPTNGVCYDVKISGSTAYIAEGTGGLSIWRLTKDVKNMELMGRFEADGRPIKQVVISGNYAMVHVGSTGFYIIDITNPADPVLVKKEMHTGLLYGFNISPELLDGRYVSCFWHVAGFFFYDMDSKPKPVYSGDNLEWQVGFDNGLAICQGKCLITSWQGRYTLVDRNEKRKFTQLQNYGIDGVKLRGKPSVFGNTLYISNRISGEVFVLNITSPTDPKLLRKIACEGNPGLVVEHENTIYVPAGYQGLLAIPR